MVASWPGSPAALAAYVSRIEVTHGVAARDLAAAAVTDVTGGFTRRPCWRVAGGNQLVARHLAGRLGTSVRLRSAVRSVEHDQEQVRLLTDDGEVSGDAVILAVPMAVLRALPFAPEVPRTYRSAWQRAGLAHNAKLHLPLTRPAAASAVQSVPGPVLDLDSGRRVGPGPAGPACVRRYRGGPGRPGRSRRAGQVGVPGGGAAARLSADPSRAMLTTWNDDPWTGESYSALTVTVADGDEDLIAAPLGRVHFAGEHTAGAWAGLMEGALRSGEHAASEVLDMPAPAPDP